MPRPNTHTINVCLLRDLAEEDWPSMDLYADMLERGLRQRSDVRVQPYTPAHLKRPGSGEPWAGRLGRALSRYVGYPAQLPRKAGGLYHIVDHSYAHLLWTLPPERTVVTCHDTDVFRAARDPEVSLATRSVCRLVASGFRRARFILADSEATRRCLVEEEGVSESRITLARLGALPAFSPESERGEAECLRRRYGLPERYWFHVGSAIPRKDLPTLFEALSGVQQTLPLVQVGARPAEIEALAARAGSPTVYPLGKVPLKDLASLYRHAQAVVLPSRNEGFGLPALEAIASGTVVVASDIDAFRELLGDAGLFFPVGDSSRLAQHLKLLLAQDRLVAEQRARAVERAQLFSWDRMATTVAELYQTVLRDL